MAVDSWPNGVTSWEDTVKFAELVFGKDIAVENYSHRLPHSTVCQRCMCRGKEVTRHCESH